MNYEEKYKELAGKIKKAYLYAQTDSTKAVLEDILPELKESEGERIRKAILNYFTKCWGNCEDNVYGIHVEDAIAWLEKQGEPKAHGTRFNTKDTAAPSERDIIGWYKTDGKLESCPMVVWFCSEEEAEKEAEENDDCFLAYWAELPEQNFEKNYWLEKQGEQKPQGKTALEAIKEEKVDNANKVEPKFKVDDWVIRKEKAFKHNTYLIKEVKDYYVCEELKGRRVSFTFDDVHKNFKLWDISDAKDGDVLAAHECYVIFKEIDGLNIKCYCTYHYMNSPSFHVDTLQNKDAFHPATKEQRDLLFQKMKEEGYEWNADKKELKELKQTKGCKE